MSTDLPSTEHLSLRPAATDAKADDAPTQPDSEADEEEEEDDEEDEPKLKYAKLTGSLTNVYRNGDSTSAFTIAGDKLVLGTHNGNIHVLSLPTLKSLRTYHAHSATITNVSVSPVPPPPAAQVASRGQPEEEKRKTDSLRSPPSSIRTTQTKTTSTASPRSQQSPQPPAIPNTPNNAIYIATASLDGHVCISSLIDPKDVQLRNFARPVQAVALSPDYKNDRTYLSAGLAGQLILTVGGKAGVTTDANTNSAAAAASSGFLGAFGLAGTDRGKDTVLHSGEGAISCIEWSLSGKWVVWITEKGIKIMRSHYKLGSEDEDDAWKRIVHEPRPNRREWEDMVGVWKARAEWVDERHLEADDHEHVEGAHGGSNGKPSEPTKQRSKRSKVEKLVVGWGNTAWILHVSEGGPASTSTPANGGKRVIGTAERMRKLIFDDCVIAGISLYTPSLLALLAYRTLDDDDRPIHAPQSSQLSSQNGAEAKTGRKGRNNRQTGLAPQLRLINVQTGAEDEIDELSISRFETLSAQDYHFGTLWIPPASVKAQQAADRWALEGMWESTRNATRLFSSSASILSNRSAESQSLENGGKASIRSPGSSVVGAPMPPVRKAGATDAHPFAASAGLKLFIYSPYDCILAVRRDLKDHLEYLLQQQDYKQVWMLVDKHPELIDDIGPPPDNREPRSPIVGSARDGGGSLADFFADDSASRQSAGGGDSNALREKQRIGELWIQQLVTTDQWGEAGQVASKVLGTSRKWEYWVYAFAQAGKFDEITPFIPSDAHLPSEVYEIVLGHYLTADVPRFQELLELWEPEKDLYDVHSIQAAILSKLDSEDVVEDSEDWRILTEALAKLYLAEGRAKEALRCYISVRNAEKAMELIQEDSLMNIIDAEDVPGLLMLKLSKEQMRSAPLDELREASSEVVKLLVGEALKGSLLPATIIKELLAAGRVYRPFLYFYFRALWYEATEREAARRAPRGRSYQHIDAGRPLVEDHADLAIELFADYDRDLLMEFLQASEVYNYEKAAAICNERDYTREFVYMLSKMGQTKEALRLIINKLGDIKYAIDFAKQNPENPELWDDLLEYSMNRPAFIKELLEEVGTAIDPVDLVRRIPPNTEIQGLKEAVAKLLRVYDIQFSISESVATVLRGEVGVGMDALRAGQKKGVRFEVLHEASKEIDHTLVDALTQAAGENSSVEPKRTETSASQHVKPGACVGCGDVFQEDGMPSLPAALTSC
ncbi:hypothetical protein BDY17DRAFT_301433 [Neohortaea acidophila]|uniref:Vps41 beta-propeller domain-containing protein n=1 Tax=Neohortaea acidophila TaxID=245834 RepID=A0A6A6PN17_9PEZI|nr:uncharacterized protein BDY17DRAFT_301433 [Neohortaea acidophila]KAF2481490.1 hypothetical protein BDY17DRAFT_301433 [Neohortaea acidophila]